MERAISSWGQLSKTLSHLHGKAKSTEKGVEVREGTSAPSHNFLTTPRTPTENFPTLVNTPPNSVVINLPPPYDGLSATSQDQILGGYHGISFADIGTPPAVWSSVFHARIYHGKLRQPRGLTSWDDCPAIPVLTTRKPTEQTMKSTVWAAALAITGLAVRSWAQEMPACAVRPLDGLETESTELTGT